MKLIKLTVVGLFGRSEVSTYVFDSSLNVLTGRNGAGKTTVMKLAWLIMSGNILLALREIKFRSCLIVTDEYECTVHQIDSNHCKIELSMNGSDYLLEDDDQEDENPFGESAEGKAANFLIPCGGSLFFPTFRRIEGGFSMGVNANARARGGLRSELDVDNSLAAISKKLSHEQHVFVSAISSQDIVSLLLKNYAALSEEANNFQTNVTSRVIERIRQFESTHSVLHDANALLSETRDEIEKIEKFREQTLAPLTAVRTLAETLFQHAGISFGTRLSFGDAAAAINSDALSAGEKQMLSFICYNAFYKNSIVFIDEPELSLHVDWQRRLYSILDSQKSGNQFIFATHSPFIYGRFPDKEVVIGADRGE